MILTRDAILAEWEAGHLAFSPDIERRQVSLSSIDLRLGTIFTRLLPRSGTVIQPARRFDPTGLVETEDLSEVVVLGRRPTFRLEPGQFWLGFTHEEIAIPGHLVGNVQGRSSLARAGLAIHVTAPHIHPGFTGQITLELFNHGPWELELYPAEDLVCQLILFRAEPPVSDEVADALSTYRGQRVPFPPRTEG